MRITVDPAAGGLACSPSSRRALASSIARSMARSLDMALPSLQAPTKDASSNAQRSFVSTVAIVTFLPETTLTDDGSQRIPQMGDYALQRRSDQMQLANPPA
jgi:hypothetical protein